MRRRSAGDFLTQAMEALTRAVDERVAKHPQGHLLTGRRTHLELTLEIPLSPPDGVPIEAIERVKQDLDGELENLLAHRAAFQPGRVFCLRCSSADCEHAAPASSREVFAGYSPTGIPRFQDFGQWLLENQHPEVDQLYRRPPQLVTQVISGRDLHAQLLPAFREKKIDYRIHGQVAAGWFPVPGVGGVPEVLALTFQVLSSAPGGRKGKRARRRLGLNVLGTGPAGEPLADLYERLGEIRWASAVRWSQDVLASIERSQGRKSATPARLSERILGVLNGIARRLQHHRRSHDRRTRHAQKHHKEGDRPTRMALTDLARASDENILFDGRRKTCVVLGEKGRAHIFNTGGKLVTSIRYSTDSIEKKKKIGIWRQASEKEILSLREVVTMGEKNSEAQFT